MNLRNNTNKMNFIIYCLVIVFISVNGDRIAGGETTTVDQYPFSASLLFNSGTGSYLHACGGTIVTASAILSAASCFYTDSSAHPATWWRVRVGSTNSNSGGIIYLINRIIPHPSFTPTEVDNDIAVLRTTWSMQYSPTIQPAALAGGAYKMDAREEVWAIGWGASSPDGPVSADLQRVQFWVVEQETCATRYEELNVTVTANMVCGGWLDVGIQGQCQGDAGSPLLQDGIVVGLFSWAEGCAAGRYPSLNTRVSPYMWWIFSHVN